MKSSHCIVSADAARARFFALDSATRSTGENVTRLVELGALSHPERRERPSEQFSDSRPGSRHGGGASGQDHAVDDHRDAHLDEYDRRFAREVADAIRQHVEALGARHLVVAAGPAMLGLLRDNGYAVAGIDTTEIGKDFTALSASQLRDRLAGDGVIPATVGG